MGIYRDDGLVLGVCYIEGGETANCYQACEEEGCRGGYDVRVPYSLGIGNWGFLVFICKRFIDFIEVI